MLLFVITGTAAATHYRYGTLSWEPTGVGNEVIFTGGQAWRASAFGAPAVGAVIQGESAIDTGDGSSEPIYLKVTSASAVNDYFTATFVRADGTPGIPHTYPGANNGGAPWLASFSSCCRISPHSSGNFHANNPDQSERLETRVDLSPPPNSSPKSALPPINPCPRDAICTIAIPFADADADPVSFRLSTAIEAGDPSYHPPGAPEAANAASVSAAGILTWDTHGATVSSTAGEHTLYSVQVMLEDGRTQTPLDFFLEIVPPDVHPPRWVTPPTPCGSTLTIRAGQPLSFDVEAVSDDGRPVTMSDLGLPAGASFPIPAPANPATSTFSWTPTLSQAGTYLVVFAAEDDRGYAAPPCGVTIAVALGPVAIAGPDVCAGFGSTAVFNGSRSFFPGGTIVSYRWDFPHGESPVFGAIITRTLDQPADLLGPYDATLTITTDTGETASDTIRITAFESFAVTATSDRARYTPFQRPSGTATAAAPCAGGISGLPVDVVVRYTTNDPALDAQLIALLGPDGLSTHIPGVLDASGRFAWRLPFAVAERFALPIGLLNPTSQLLAIQGDYIVEAHVTSGSATGVGTTTFDVILDPQFPLDEPPAMAAQARRPEVSA